MLATLVIPIFKTRARVSEVMSKRRRLNLAMIRKLHKQLHIPFECLVQEYKPRRPAAASEVVAAGALGVPDDRDPELAAAHEQTCGTMTRGWQTLLRCCGHPVPG